MVYIMRKKRFIPFHQLHLPVVPVVRARSAERKRAHTCYINEKNSVDGQYPAPPHQCTHRDNEGQDHGYTHELHKSYIGATGDRPSTGSKPRLDRWEPWPVCLPFAGRLVLVDLLEDGGVPSKRLGRRRNYVGTETSKFRIFIKDVTELYR